MTTNQPKQTLSVKLHTAELRIANLEATHASELKTLNDDLTRARSNLSHQLAEAGKANSELVQIHAFLDAVPNPPARSTTPDDYGRKTESSAMTRLSVYLATRSA